MSLRFIIMSSLLLFIVASTVYAALHNKGGNNAGCIATSDEEILPKNVYSVAAAAAARENALRSRKMVVDKTNTLNEKAKINVVARGKHTSSRRIILSENKNVNFVAFTADYHGPRHHPPKNN